MTTLANMTEEERAQCRGLWCETADGLAIIIEPFVTDGALDTAVVLSLKPKVEILQRIAAYVIPRRDLPRAWNPDGTSPAGGWEHAHIPGLGESTRRWVGQWEEA